MKDLSNLRIGMDQEEVLYNLPVNSSDTVKVDVRGVFYSSYHYFCKTGVESRYTGGHVSISRTPAVDYWMTFLDGKLVFKGPVKKYLDAEQEEFRQIGGALSVHKLKAPRVKITPGFRRVH